MHRTVASFPGSPHEYMNCIVACYKCDLAIATLGVAVITIIIKREIEDSYMHFAGVSYLRSTPCHANSLYHIIGGFTMGFK